MIHNLSESNSLVSQWLSELRDTAVQADRMRFRRNLERIGEVMAYEISKTLVYTPITVKTPLGEATGAVPAQQPVLATILRAGLPLHQGLLNYFDKADCAFVGSYRQHTEDDTFEIHQGYLTSPSVAGRPLLLADPMLATGSSIVLALQCLTEYETPSEIHIVCVIGCDTGMAHVQANYPAAHIWLCAIDNGLTEQGYIVPGLGDAGDLGYGKKIQY
jgi:uracil phosphoribosyltransferase